MLPYYLEMWRGKLLEAGGREFSYENFESDDTFRVQLISELYELSSLLERVETAAYLADVQRELSQFLIKGKAVGMGATDRKCKNCGRDLVKD